MKGRGARDDKRGSARDDKEEGTRDDKAKKSINLNNLTNHE